MINTNNSLSWATVQHTKTLLL